MQIEKAFEQMTLFGLLATKVLIEEMEGKKMTRYAIKFGKKGYFYKTFLTKEQAMRASKIKGGKVIRVTERDIKKIFG